MATDNNFVTLCYKAKSSSSMANRSSVGEVSGSKSVGGASACSKSATAESNRPSNESPVSEFSKSLYYGPLVPAVGDPCELCKICCLASLSCCCYRM